MYSRRNCLLIHGIGEKENEDTDAVVANFFEHHIEVPGFTFDLNLLVRAHRIGPRGKK